MAAVPAIRIASSRHRTSSLSTCRARWRRCARTAIALMPGRARCPACSHVTALAISFLFLFCVEGFVAYLDPALLFGTHVGPGAFYKLMPHNAMAFLFGAVFAYAVLALVFSM